MSNTFFMPNKSEVGTGALKTAIGQIASLGCKKALVVTDQILAKVGTLKMLTDLLDGSGVAYEIYDGTRPNPTCGDVETGVALVQKHKCDMIISLGGGSIHDCAKGIGVVATNGGDIRDYEGVDQTTKPPLPLVSVNTTAGTGAEMTRFCIITDEERKVKMAIIDWRISPLIAVNDPLLTESMPKGLTAADRS